MHESHGAAGGGETTAESRVLLRTAIAMVAVYAGLRFVLPWLSVWIGLGQNPAPVPGSAMALYMMCAVLGALVYVSSDEQRWRSFRTPIVRLFLLGDGSGRRPRLVVLGLVPLLVGWIAWGQVAVRGEVPAVVRVQHPAQPGTYEGLRNPLRELDEESLTAAVREGTVQYQKNCRPCHGTNADGGGPLARGLRLRPVDFTDPGTIATLVESYALWRIQRGFGGLPQLATPWHSAMPAWEDEMDDDEMWKIILAEYRIAGKEPRMPEGEER